MVKRLIYIVFLTALLSINFIKVNAYSFDSTQKVYDYAAVLSDNEKLELKQDVKKFIDKYNIDMVLVVVRHYTSNDLKSYTEDFYYKNNFGLGYSKKGIILVLDVKNNESNIKLNGNVNLYSDTEITSILNSINDKSDYYEKAKTFIKLSDKYALEDNIIKENKKSSDFLKNIIYPVLIALIISSIVSFVLVYKTKLNKNNLILYSNIVSIEINKEQDKFMTTNTKQINR